MARETFRLVGAFIEAEPVQIIGKPMKGKPPRQEVVFKMEDGHTIVIRLLEHQVYDLRDNQLGKL